MPDLKPELSHRNKYWIPKHRYYELKHYCLQYPEWKKMYNELGGMKAYNASEIHWHDYVRAYEDKILKKTMLSNAMELVEKCVEDCTDVEVLRNYIFKAVTEAVPYVQLRTKDGIPCGSDMYYSAYRKFFWILSQRRGI